MRCTVCVRAWAQGPDDGNVERALQPSASARTNDLGEYRLYWINPGRYFVSANAARSALDLITSNASRSTTFKASIALAHDAT